MFSSNYFVQIRVFYIRFSYPSFCLANQNFAAFSFCERNGYKYFDDFNRMNICKINKYKFIMNGDNSQY